MRPSVPGPNGQSEWDGCRRILHCDMDCFYAAVHMRNDPSLRGKPVVIGGRPEGRGVVAAASYEARRFGIHSAMPAARALSLCPQAVFLRPDFQLYKTESARILEILREFTTELQPVSIDEAYLDVTRTFGEWGSATTVAREIRRRVQEERSLAISIGVAPNKLVAKIASDFGKPDGLTVVHPGRVQEFLDPLPVRRLPGIGPATEKRLHRLGIETVADLRAVPLDQLQKRFGRSGRWFFDSARGVDERPVRLQRSRKSLSHEETFSADLTSVAVMRERLRDLSERVAADLMSRNLSARTLTIKVRFSDFTTLSRSITATAATCDVETIFQRAKGLLRRTDADNRSVRLLGLGASNLIEGSLGQLELFR